MGIRPLSDRVIIKRMAQEEKSAGGIVLPDSAKEKPAEGKVIAVGPGKDGNAVGLKAGEKVLFGKYSGQEVSHNGEELLIMREDEIIAVVE